MVIDASSVLEIILQTKTGKHLEKELLKEPSLIAPHLLDVEVCQVLRRFVLGRELTAKRGSEALEDFSQIRIIRYPHRFYWQKIWNLRFHVTAYDAAYLALAILLEVPLMTQDQKLAYVAQKHVPVVIF
jgi:predicted nucleic acid-binding protein